MIQLSPERIEALHPWFSPERRHLIGLHTLHTGHGDCYVDQWPGPQVVLVTIGALCSLSGDHNLFTQKDALDHMQGLAHTSREFLPILQTVFPNIQTVDRVVLELHDEPPALPEAPGVTVRRLEADDASHLAGLAPDLGWISSTWGGPAGMAASGFAWGAFIDNRLVSVAGTFLVGDALEDIGVVTEADYRGRGLAVRCAAALCTDVRQRGRRASWTTSYSNPASLRTAEKLGFKDRMPDTLYVLGQADPPG
jgi:predicted GNAT family acetyltransferase